MAEYTLSYTRTLSFAGNYVAVTSSRDYTRYRDSTFSQGFTTSYDGTYSRDFIGNYSRDYTGYYSRSFSRTRIESYAGDRTQNFTAVRTSVTSTRFDEDYFSRTLNYTTYYSRARAQNFLRDYTAFYGGSYTRVCTRSSEVVTCTVFVGAPPGFQEN